MSKSQLTTPILIEDNGKRYKFFYISFEKDGSIYLSFPRKKGYKVKKTKDIVFSIKGEAKVALEEIKESYVNPRISFHPGKKAIHINCFDNAFKLDSPIQNMAENPGKLCIPFAQVIFSHSFDFLDEYQTDKYKSPLITQIIKQNSTASLNYEIWIHSLGTYIDPNDLPIREVRGKVVGCFRFENALLKDYTCTIVMYEISVEAQGENRLNIIVACFNADAQYAFELEAL